MHPRWQAFVRDLEERGYASVYLDRLRRRLDVEQAQQELEREIVREMACALGRTEEKLNLALLRLELAGRAVTEAPTDVERRACMLRFNELRQHALQARYDLLVHREAVGFRQNTILERLYPIPPAYPVAAAGSTRRIPRGV